jgi:hypothetical protein
MTAKGLLLAMMEPPAGFEEEFQDWYDTEHVPDRMSLPEFETGGRYVCRSGFPKYVALYDLISLAAACANPQYSKATGQGVSSWNHRLRTKVLGRYRFTGDQIFPGQAKMGDGGPVIRLMVLRFRHAQQSDEKQMLEGLRENFDGRSGLSQFRLFRGVETPGDYIATVEFQTNADNVEVNPAPFKSAIKHLDLINVYTPYWRQIVLREKILGH